ncbi:MAG: putative acetolactate synthase large subunit IlvX [Syntrophorhabdus sp. PtaB.Bin047]|nr:MAG: putative acetolactate synthase large subunit IlvX [Syntrophorhabdus sp. PtaB.Bin047]
MNGAELALKTAVLNGIDICFANAGTTEIPLVAALDGQAGIKTVLGLFEGVCTGAADGFGRVLDRPAMALLHLGPGFANGIACLHNARRAKAPVVAVIGEHASWHRDADPPLCMDIAAMAGAVSGWKRTCRSARGLSRDMAAVIAASSRGQVASLIIPNDHQWADCGDTSPVMTSPAFEPVDHEVVDRAAKALRAGRRGAMVLGGRALREKGLVTAARIRAATGCDLLANSFPGYMDRGGSLPVVTRIPYFPEPALELMARYDTVVLAGAWDPVTFFGYEGIPSGVITAGTVKIAIDGPGQDVNEALEALAGSVGRARRRTPAKEDGIAPGTSSLPAGPLTPETVCAAIAALQPGEGIVVDEGLTTTFPYYPLSHGRAPHGFMTIAGGAIGYGMPCAVGAALAAPDRPVINIQADGSAMYTVQALWTMAREGLNVTTLLCNNGGYRIIAMELERAGLVDLGEASRALVDIDGPPIDWVHLSRGLGVPATRVEDARALAREMRKAMKEPGPHLIEMMIRK